MEKRIFKNEDYRYTDREVAIQRVLYQDTAQIRSRNFLLSLPLGLLLMTFPRYRRIFPTKIGGYLAGSLISFMVLDFPNDFRFYEQTEQMLKDHSARLPLNMKFN